MVTILSFVISAVAFGQGYDPRFGGACAAFGVLFAIYGACFIRKSRKIIL